MPHTSVLNDLLASENVTVEEPRDSRQKKKYENKYIILFHIQYVIHIFNNRILNCYNISTIYCRHM